MIIKNKKNPSHGERNDKGMYWDDKGACWRSIHPDFRYVKITREPGNVRLIQSRSGSVAKARMHGHKIEHLDMEGNVFRTEAASRTRAPEAPGRPPQVLRRDRYLAELRAKAPKKRDGSIARNKMKGGCAYIGRYPTTYAGWFVTGKAQADDRVQGYNTYTPYRDFEVILRVVSRDRQAAEAFIQERLAVQADMLGVRAGNKQSEWFQILDEAEAFEIFQDLVEECVEQPWFVSVSWEDSSMISANASVAA